MDAARWELWKSIASGLIELRKQELRVEFKRVIQKSPTNDLTKWDMIRIMANVLVAKSELVSL